MKKYQLRLNDHLVLAANTGNLSLVLSLIEAGADVHFDHCDALRYAALNGHLDVVMVLAEQGVDLDMGIGAAKRSNQVHVLEWLRGYQISQKEKAELSAVPVGAIQKPPTGRL